MTGIQWGNAGGGSTAEQAAQARDYFANAFGRTADAAAPPVDVGATTAAEVATELAAPVEGATPDLAGALADAAAPAALEARPDVPAETIAEGGESVVNKLLGQVRGARQGVQDRGGISDLLELLSRPKGATTAADAVTPATGALAGVADRLAQATPGATQAVGEAGEASATAMSRITEALAHLRG